jgi:hypothetical protein
MRKFLYGAFLLLAACGPASNADFHTKIVFDNPLPFKSEDHVLKREYINLEFNENGYFSDVDKVIIGNDKIYLLEKMTKKGVICFNNKGEYLYTIGTHGQGPEEFQDISDMNIDHEGNLILLDRGKNAMLIYGTDQKMLQSRKLPFRAQSFATMADKNWAFSLVTENDESIYHRAKLIFTDQDFNNPTIIQKYQEEETAAFYSLGHFATDGENILFYKAVADSLIRFDKHGNVLQSIFLDFGSKSLPQEIQYDMMKIMDVKPSETYSYITVTPRLLGKYILGLTSGKAAPGTFLADLSTGQTYTTVFGGNEISHTDINKPIGQIGDWAFINYINGDMASLDRDFDILPIATQDHLKNEGTTLIIHYLK